MPILPQPGQPVKRRAWVPEAAFELEDGAFRVYAALTIFADGRGTCWPSQQTLVTLSKRSLSTVRRRIRWLERNGWLTIKKRRRSTAMYQLKTGQLVTAQEPTQDRSNENQDRSKLCALRPVTQVNDKHPKEQPIYKHNVAREDINDETKADGIEAARRLVAALSGPPRSRGSGPRRVGSLL